MIVEPEEFMVRFVEILESYVDTANGRDTVEINKEVLLTAIALLKEHDEYPDDGGGTV